MPIRGVIFDLDGTLVNSGLDFAAMRREMGLGGGLPLLEAIAELPDDDARRCWEILDAHERAGAERATLIPGVVDFLDELHEHGIKRAILTRNARTTTQAT